MTSKNGEGPFHRLLATIRRVFERKATEWVSDAPVEKVQEVSNKLEQLSIENQKLREELNQQSQELAQAQQQVTDLKAECASLKRQVKLAETEIDHSRSTVLVPIFKDMADERHNRLLRKLLAFDGEEPKLLRDLVRYLRDDLTLDLEGRVGDEITLTKENQYHYELYERFPSLPCRVRIIGRGISFDGQPVLRTQVEIVEKEANNGN